MKLFIRKTIYIQMILLLTLMLSLQDSLHFPVSAQADVPETSATVSPKRGSELLSRFEEQKWVRVIVQLDVPLQGQKSTWTTSAIHEAQNVLQQEIQGKAIRVIRAYDIIPFIAVEVDQQGLEMLLSSPQVLGVEEDVLMFPTLAQSVPLINADDAWAAGYSGAGQVVAVLDTGVDKNHPALSGKVISEACYSTTNPNSSPPTTSMCPGGVSSTTAPNSALPYIYNCPDGQCNHGTHVAGIVTGNNEIIKGVAKDANLIAIQVFSKVGTSSIGSWSTDQLAGLQRVYQLRNDYNIAAINLSLGSSNTYSSNCDSLKPSYKSMVDQLRSVGIATIVASGNGGQANSISSPACISSVISVGATDKADSIAGFSNSASFLDLLAPGVSIYSSLPNNNYAYYNGTSMAAPHVAGAWAVIRSAGTNSSVSDILTAFKNTGVPVYDGRNGFTKPRIDVLAALQVLLTTQIGAPANLTASDGTDLDQVILSWDPAANATFYQIFRSSTSNIADAVLLKDNQASSPYLDTAAVPGTIYTYWVKGCASLACSTSLSVDTGWRGTIGLAAPTGVQASDGLFNNRIQVSWNAVGGATYYQVYRSENNNPAGAKLMISPIVELSFDDTSAVTAVQYYYWLKACNESECSNFSMADPGYLQEIYYIYFPFIGKAVLTESTQIFNGDFENGSDGTWSEYSLNGWELIVDSNYIDLNPHSGSWLAWLGGDDDEVAQISQDISIMSGSSYLHFWYWIASEDVCGYDTFHVKVNGNDKFQVSLCSNNNTFGWIEGVLDLSDSAGDTVTIQFEVNTDISLNSNLFLDDVIFTNVATVSQVGKEYQSAGFGRKR